MKPTESSPSRRDRPCERCGRPNRRQRGQQADAEFLLQRDDLPTARRLDEVQAFGRSAEVQRFGEGD
jgi:hypothetical protein